jgi:hypothetical protein
MFLVYVTYVVWPGPGSGVLGLPRSVALPNRSPTPGGVTAAGCDERRLPRLSVHGLTWRPRRSAGPYLRHPSNQRANTRTSRGGGALTSGVPGMDMGATRDGPYRSGRLLTGPWLLTKGPDVVPSRNQAQPLPRGIPRRHQRRAVDRRSGAARCHPGVRRTLPQPGLDQPQHFATPGSPLSAPPSQPDGGRVSRYRTMKEMLVRWVRPGTSRKVVRICPAALSSGFTASSAPKKRTSTARAPADPVSTLAPGAQPPVSVGRTWSLDHLRTPVSRRTRSRGRGHGSSWRPTRVRWPGPGPVPSRCPRCGEPWRRCARRPGSRSRSPVTRSERCWLSRA